MPRTLSVVNRWMLSSCLGMLLLTVLILLMSLTGEIRVEKPPEIVAREVRSLPLPPPPPPPPVKRQGGPGGSPRPSLARARVETPVDLEVMDLVADIGAGSIGVIGAGGIGNGTGSGNGLGDGSGDWEIVGLGELDAIPMVRSAPLLSYPEEAIKQNVLEFEVKIHIIIDEEGRTYPVRILKNPFPSMNRELMKFTSTVKFTPPTKLGVPVKAEYLWPLRMKKAHVQKKP